MSSLSKYKVITVTHHNLNVQEIGHFYLKNLENVKNDDNRIASGVKRLQEAFEIEECQYLETCNRVTYLFYGDCTLDSRFLKAFFSTVNPSLDTQMLDSISKFVTSLSGEQAVKHIFELAASMDSLVVGEREIFRQYRKAYNDCNALKLTGDKLRLLEKATVNTAKKVYNNTKIGEKALSIVSLAMNALLKKQINPDARILLIGAGETNALVGKFLKKYNYKNIKIYNRSLHNAQELSLELNAESCHMAELNKIKGAFDIIFICTSANEIIIDDDLYREMIANDDSEKTVIDLAVPRNVSAEVVENNSIHYIDIESLKKISEANLVFRKKEVEKARPLINQGIVEFNHLYQEREIEKAMKDVPAAIQEVKERALTKVYKDRISELDPQAQELINEMMQYMEKKCISVPMKIAKSKLAN